MFYHKRYLDATSPKKKSTHLYMFMPSKKKRQTASKFVRQQHPKAR